MNYNFTDRVRKVLAMAREEAIRLQHDYVGTEHILLGLLREQDGVAAQVLMNLGLKLDEVREEVLNLLGAGGAEAEETIGAGAPSPAFSRSSSSRRCGRASSI